MTDVNPDKISYEKAVFPLNSVIFPGGIQSLQIFEQRYLSLIKSCMKYNHGFVVALISDGKEVGALPKIHLTGTYVEITDWEQLENTLLAITITGIRRTNILSTSSINNNLMTAQTKDFRESPTCKHKFILEKKYNNLVETLQQLCRHPFISKKYSDINYSSSAEVCHRLSELLPISNMAKQDLLEEVDINLYIEKLATIVKNLGG